MFRKLRRLYFSNTFVVRKSTMKLHNFILRIECHLELKLQFLLNLSSSFILKYGGQQKLENPSHNVMDVGTEIDLMSLVALLVLFRIATPQNLICFYFAIHAFRVSRLIVHKRIILKGNKGNKPSKNCRSSFASLVKMFW